MSSSLNKHVYVVHKFSWSSYLDDFEKEEITLRFPQAGKSTQTRDYWMNLKSTFSPNAWPVPGNSILSIPWKSGSSGSSGAWQAQASHRNRVTWLTALITLHRASGSSSAVTHFSQPTANVLWAPTERSCRTGRQQLSLSSHFTTAGRTSAGICQNQLAEPGRVWIATGRPEAPEELEPLTSKC